MTERKVKIVIPSREEMLSPSPPADMAAAVVEPTLREKYRHCYLTVDELRDLPKPEPLIDGVLHRRGYHVLRGRGSTYKSYIALDWSLSIATGTAWNGRPVQRGRVLFIAGEGADGLPVRVGAWEADRGVKASAEDFKVRGTALDMYDPREDFDELIEHVEAEKFDLVVIDTLRRVSGRADENNSQMGRVIDNITKVQRAAPNTAVLVIAHTTKGKGSTRGFSGIEDDADVVWDSDEKAKGEIELSNVKMKNGPETAKLRLNVRAVGDNIVLAEAGSRTSRTLDQEYVYDQILNDPGKKKGDYQTRDGKDIYRVIDSLIKKGHVWAEQCGNEKHIYPVRG